MQVNCIDMSNVLIIKFKSHVCHFLWIVLTLLYIPNRNSPKLPHPIFLPTLKLGPTIKTPELPELALFVECIVLLLVLDTRLFGSRSLSSWDLLLSVFCTVVILTFEHTKMCLYYRYYPGNYDVVCWNDWTRRSRYLSGTGCHTFLAWKPVSKYHSN